MQVEIDVFPCVPATAIVVLLFVISPRISALFLIINPLFLNQFNSEWFCGTAGVHITRIFSLFEISLNVCEIKLISSE